MNNKSDDKNFWLIIILIFTAFISVPLFSSTHIIAGHDWIFHIMRIEGMKDSLAGGQFPVKITGYSFNSYGEASGIFYPNLFLYIPAIFRLCNISVAVAYNLFCILINLATVLCTYWAFSRLFNSNCLGAITSMIYSGFFYRLIDIYSRAAIGEALAMAFMPLAVISLWLMLHRQTSYWIPFTIACTCVLQSHIISSLMLAAICICIILYSYRQLKQRENLTALTKSAIFILLLNIWFYVPFYNFYHQFEFNMQNSILEDHILSNRVSTWATFNYVQGFFGYAIVLVIALFIIKHFFKKHSGINMTPAFYFMLLISIVTVILTFARTPWVILKTIPYVDRCMDVIQYPFRVMMIAAFTFSYCATISLKQLADGLKKCRVLIISVCFIIAGSNMLFLAQPLFKDKPEIEFKTETDIRKFIIKKMIMGINSRYYFSMFTVKMNKDEIDKIAHIGYADYIYKGVLWQDLVLNPEDDWFKDIFKPTIIPFDGIEPAEAVTNFTKKGTTLTFNVNANEPLTMRLPLFYYPGYTAYTADRTELNLYTNDDKHRISIDVPVGEHFITVKYVGQTLWTIAEYISLISLFIFAIKIWRENKI